MKWMHSFRNRRHVRDFGGRVNHCHKQTTKKNRSTKRTALKSSENSKHFHFHFHISSSIDIPCVAEWAEIMVGSVLRMKISHFRLRIAPTRLGGNFSISRTPSIIVSKGTRNPLSSESDQSFFSCFTRWTRNDEKLKSDNTGAAIDFVRLSFTSQAHMRGRQEGVQGIKERRKCSSKSDNRLVLLCVRDSETGGNWTIENNEIQFDSHFYTIFREPPEEIESSFEC